MTTSLTNNTLRSHLILIQSQKPKKRLQRHIVNDRRNEIIDLIQNDGASLVEVIAALMADGEPVLEKGFAAALRKEIGTIKDIRGGIFQQQDSSSSSNTNEIRNDEKLTDEDFNFSVRRGHDN